VRRRVAEAMAPVSKRDKAGRMHALGTNLGVWAHPDDEAYLSAGLMAMAVHAGSRVACVTATRGELGSLDEERWPISTLPAVREAELAVSLGVLGVHDHEWLDYPDGGCGEIASTEAVGRIADAIHRVEPDTVLTFGPDGMTGHPDHRAVSAWTTAALGQAGTRGARLLYATKTARWADRFGSVVDPLGVFGPDGPPCTPDSELAVALRLNERYLDLKMAALRAQASQVTVLCEAMGEATYRDWVADEWFRSGDRARR
jgi:LmbE family N-acetylglucosaminyl deacetylase